MIDFIMCKLVRNAASKGALKSVKALTIKRALDYEERQNVLDSESVINLAAQNHSLSQIPESIITLNRLRKTDWCGEKLDEQFRAFVSASVNVSPIGKDIMRKKVFGRSFKDSPSLKTQMARGVFQGTLNTTLGPITVPLIAMDRDVLQRFFTRLTKGLLATFYSDVDYFDLKFAVTQLNQFGTYHPTFKTITSILTADQRGNGLFRFWHGVAQERRTAGVWIYQFYDAALFMVTHGKDA